jgi:adenylate cyclase
MSPSIQLTPSKDSAPMRVDPGWTGWRHYLAGLAYFGMNRFEDAIASLKRIDSQSDGHWPNFFGLIVRMSADGHLGHTVDIADAKQKLERVMSEDDRPELTGLMAQNYFRYKNHRDIERLLAGLRKVSVPDLPFGFDPKSSDRLSGTEIKALFFGHEIQGQEVTSSKAYWQKSEADGSYRATVCAAYKERASPTKSFRHSRCATCSFRSCTGRRMKLSAKSAPCSAREAA